MTTVMVVVADRTGAKLLTHAGPGKDLELLRELKEPSGRTRNREIDADRPGRVHDRVGPGRHAMAKEEPPHERVAADFARAVARHVEEARNQNRFDEVVLIAEPRFLGMLSDALDPVTASKLRGTLQKDLSHIPLRDLRDHLGELLPIA